MTIILVLVGAVVCYIVVIYGANLLGAIFIAMYNTSPAITILWGLSGIGVLIGGYVLSSRTLYWIGGVDLGVFLMMWGAAAATGRTDDAR